MKKVKKFLNKTPKKEGEIRRKEQKKKGKEMKEKKMETILFIGFLAFAISKIQPSTDNHRPFNLPIQKTQGQGERWVSSLRAVSMA